MKGKHLTDNQIMAELQKIYELQLREKWNDAISRINYLMPMIPQAYSEDLAITRLYLEIYSNDFMAIYEHINNIDEITYNDAVACLVLYRAVKLNLSNSIVVKFDMDDVISNIMLAMRQEKYSKSQRVLIFSILIDLECENLAISILDSLLDACSRDDLRCGILTMLDEECLSKFFALLITKKKNELAIKMLNKTVHKLGNKDKIPYDRWIAILNGQELLLRENCNDKVYIFLRSKCVSFATQD